VSTPGRISAKSKVLERLDFSSRLNTPLGERAAPSKADRYRDQPFHPNSLVGPKLPIGVCNYHRSVDDEYRPQFARDEALSLALRSSPKGQNCSASRLEIDISEMASARQSAGLPGEIRFGVADSPTSSKRASDPCQPTRASSELRVYPLATPGSGGRQGAQFSKPEHLRRSIVW
jgi:hypothetical protein